jgi:hypothetical protein
LPHSPTPYITHPKGTFIKRISIHGRGRSGTITKPRTHVRISVMESDAKPKKQVVVRENEAPWKDHRRKAVKRFEMAQEYNQALNAGLV